MVEHNVVSERYDGEGIVSSFFGDTKSRYFCDS